MIVVWIVFFIILLVSFITGICITVVEEKKTNSFVVLDKHVLPNKMQLIKSGTVMSKTGLDIKRKMNAVTLDVSIEEPDIIVPEYDDENVILEKTIKMKKVEVEKLGETMFFDGPILMPEYDE